MGRFRIALAGACVALGLCLHVSDAQAADAPRVGPIPDWVHAPPALSVEKDAARGLPVAMLLHDMQVSFDADGWTEFHEIKAKAQSSAGLQGLGTIPFRWSPWSDTLTFHRARILRDGQTIDVLPKDGGFTVLRRETGLEQAMLTGELTAVLQPEGLQVGDVLEVAVSIRHADPLLKGHSSAFLAGWDLAPASRIRLEASWPSSLPVLWKATAGLPILHAAQAAGVTTVAMNLDDVLPPVLPAHAPQRFQHGRQVEFTTFAGWDQVAAAMAPLFTEAATLPPNSPVADQARRIALASADPKSRAAAALHLVQAQVRYLAHAEAGGGLKPQSADETWRLRYGDCKAKTALLLALLNQLGLPAEPVLASSTGGDGLDGHLPSVDLFDHVLARVQLSGRDYWLDGAREGDRGLDELTTPGFGWVLPLVPKGATLERIEPAPLTRPQMVQIIRYDASGGVTAPEPTHLDTLFTGDLGALIHAKFAAVPTERMDAALRAYWTGVHTAFTPAHVAETWDPATGGERLTADGYSKLDWSDPGLELTHVELGGPPDIKRDPAASDPNAPYAVDYPTYVETDESVVLPPGDVVPASATKDADLDEVIAGIAYQRKATVTGKVFRVVASQRSVTAEVSAKAAQASVDRLTALGKVGVYAPAGSRAREANDAFALDSNPVTAQGHLSRGEALLDATRYAAAAEEFDKAIALDPKLQLAWADRAVAHARLKEPAALSDADKADTLGPPSLPAARARGLLAQQTDDVDGAKIAFRRALSLAPDDHFSLTHLLDLEVATDDVTGASGTLKALVRSGAEPADRIHLDRAAVDRIAHREDDAKRELELAPADTSEALLIRARLSLQDGDKVLARADADAANRLKPSADAWLVRAEADGGYNHPAADEDVAAAAKIAPDDLNVRLWSVNEATQREDYAAALPLLDRLVAAHPDLSDLFVGRAQIEARLGRTAATEADFDHARAAGADPGLLCHGEVEARSRPLTAQADCARAISAAPRSALLHVYQAILDHRQGQPSAMTQALDAAVARTRGAAKLNSLCYQVAEEGMALDRALAACDASLKLRPDDAATLDSRAFVLMRMGRNAEALAAYDAALAKKPDLFAALYGRSLVETRLGRAAEGKRDAALALASQPYLRKKFERMGVN